MTARAKKQPAAKSFDLDAFRRETHRIASRMMLIAAAVEVDEMTEEAPRLGALECQAMRAILDELASDVLELEKVRGS